MEILELSKWISEEQKAIEYLRKKKVLKEFKSYPPCKKENSGKQKGLTINVVSVSKNGVLVSQNF